MKKLIAAVLVAGLATFAMAETIRQKGNFNTPANGGTGTSTAFTAGSVVFSGSNGVYAQSNAGLFWDNTNTRLGIGYAVPASTLDVLGSAQFGNTVAVSSIAANGDIKGAADAYFSLVLSTQAAGAAGALVTKSCPTGSPYVLTGGCSCTGTAVGTVTGIVNMPFPTITAAGTMPTGWQCQSADSTTGQACALFMVCSRIRF